MSYCPKFGNKFEETMIFCPRCVASLKGITQTSQPPATQPNRNDETEKLEKQEISEYGFLGYLMGGLILITIGVFALLDLTSPSTSGQDVSAMFLIIGVIIIIAAVYIGLTARKKIFHTK